MQHWLNTAPIVYLSIASLKLLFPTPIILKVWANMIPEYFLNKTFYHSRTNVCVVWGVKESKGRKTSASVSVDWIHKLSFCYVFKDHKAVKSALLLTKNNIWQCFIAAEQHQRENKKKKEFNPLWIKLVKLLTCLRGCSFLCISCQSKLKILRGAMCVYFF